LAIVQIEDGKVPRRLLAIAGRKIDDQIAPVAEKAGAKLFVFAELRVGHGAIIIISDTGANPVLRET